MRVKAKAAMLSVAEGIGLKKSALPDDLENVSDQFLRCVEHMNKRRLQEILTKLDLSSEGTLVELQQRILTHYSSKSTTDGKKAAADEKKAAADEKEAAADEKKATKRKKFMITDPAEISPHCYHRDLFQANFPLVDVVEVPKWHRFPVRDKFEGVVLDEDTTYEARREWISRMFDVARCFKVPENEEQAFPQHFAFLEPLKNLTRPSREDVEMQNSYSRKRKWRYEDVMHIGRPKVRKVQKEEHEGMYIVPDHEEVPEPLGANGSDGDYSGLLLAAEETVELRGDLKEDEDVPTGFADGVLHIFDDPGFGMRSGGNPDRVAGILERKFTEDELKWNARYQGGFYAIKHSLDNFSKGHGTPIYVLVMTSSTWSYGILVPEGYVQIRDGSVYASSMENFRRHQSMTGECTVDYNMLEKKLQDGTEFYQRCYRDNPTAVYKDGPMLVGTYYLSSTWYNLPRMGIGGGKDEHGRRLFDGLLRLVIGDSVMDLSKEDFDERIQLWRQMKMELLDSWFC